MAQQLFITIGLSKRSAAASDVRVRSINGYELPGWQRGPTFTDYMRRLVKKGWTVTCSVGRATVLFERPNARTQIQPKVMP